jgi:hypothetical protein
MKSLTIATILAIASFTLAIPPFDPAGAKNIGNGHGGQFIDGQCLSNADCASGCCANPVGICSGPNLAFQQGKTGCGFGSGTGLSGSTGGGGLSGALAAAAGIFGRA